MLGRHGQGGGVILPGVQEAGLASGGVGCFPNVIHDFIKKNYFISFSLFCAHVFSYAMVHICVAKGTTLFYHVGTRYGAQFIRFARRQIYSLGHLLGLINCLFCCKEAF